MKSLIATSGITHSGKTEFGKLIGEAIPNHPVIDSDQIYTKLNELIPLIKQVERSRNNVSINNPRIRHVILEDILKFFLSNNSSVICTNGNTTFEGRAKLRNLAYLYQAQFILVSFALPLDILYERIQNTTRSVDLFTHSNTFNDVLQKQLLSFAEPQENEADYFYKITDSKEISNVISQISLILES